MVLCDTIALGCKYFIKREPSIITAILPRARMEPLNTLTFVGVALVFFSANIDHFAIWYFRKIKQ